MKKLFERSICMLLALLMLMTGMTFSAFAESEEVNRVVSEVEMRSNIPESEFQNLWVGDVFCVSPMLWYYVEYSDGTQSSFGESASAEYTVVSGDCAELATFCTSPMEEEEPMGRGIKFTSCGQATVRVKVASQQFSEYETEKTYTFSVSERPSDRPVSADFSFSSPRKLKIGEMINLFDCYVTFENLNYGYADAYARLSDRDFYIPYGGAGGGTYPEANEKRKVTLSVSRSYGFAAIPGTYTVQPVLNGEEISNPAVIEVEAPEIRDNLPKTVKVGTTLDFITELENTILQNSKVSKYEDKNNYYIDEYGWSYKEESKDCVAYRPSVTVIEGADCVQQSEQDYTNTLKSSEKLTFVKDGRVTLKITYRQIQTVSNFKPQNIEKTVTINVKSENPPVDSSSVFSDIAPGKWYKEYVDYVVSNHIFNGTSETTFEPSGTMTRAMFVQVLANLENLTLDRNAETKFTDVPAGKWYTGAVKWASENGIVDGMTETTFEPNANVQRQQMCVMLVRYADFTGIDFEMKEPPKSFADEAQIQNYAKNAVDICQRAGIISGMTPDTFAPRDNATRAQVAKIFSIFHRDYMA